MAKVNEFKYILFADYFQFYIHDANLKINFPSWTEEAVNRRFVVLDAMVAVRTARNMHVPVVIEIHNSVPEVDLNYWDQAIECSIALKSGELMVTGCNEIEQRIIDVTPDIYRARILYGDLNSLSKDGLEGEDNYRIQLWPGVKAPVLELKTCTN